MMIEPTVEQAEQCAIAQQEIVETIQRLIGEGMDRRCVTAGLAAASAATIMTLYGGAEVSPWFAKQSVMSTYLGAAGNS